MQNSYVLIVAKNDAANQSKISSHLFVRCVLKIPLESLKSADMDSLLVEEAWRGKVAIKFILASQDLSAPVAPDPVFLLCSRYGYITKSAQIAVEHFRSYAMDVQSEIWFESSGCPLKWFVYSLKVF